jgi:hypothetical protein
MEKYSKETAERVLLNIESQRFKENLTNDICFYKNCIHRPIDSHVIQRAFLGEILAEDNNVYVYTPQNVARGISQGKEVFFEKTSINQSGIFDGFCGDKGDFHDAKLFRGIEVDVEITPTDDYVFLYSYRSLVYHLWLNRGLTLFKDEKTSKMLDNPVISDLTTQVKGVPAKVNALLQVESELLSFENLKQIFEKYINSDGGIGKYSDDFLVKVIPLNGLSVDFATLGTRVHSSKYPITLGVLPQYKNKPNLFFIVAHKDDETNVLIKGLTEISSDNLSEHCWVIQNLPMKWSTNIFLSPKLYNHLVSTGELSYLKKYIGSSELADFNDYQNFNLFSLIFNENQNQIR